MFTAIVQNVDVKERTLRVKGISPENEFTLSYRDDTMIEVSPSEISRLDEYLDAKGRFPFVAGQKVNVTWRQTVGSSKVIVVRLANPR